MEIQNVLKSAQAQLDKISDPPRLDAEWILLHVLGKDNAQWLITHDNERLSDNELKTYQTLIQERATGKPLAYILGHWDFYGRTFFINENVLVPRPATEYLIERAKSVIPELSHKLKRPLTIADIGTGSGCIAITLALEIPNAVEKIYATDISPTALRIAQENAAKHTVTNKIDFIEGDLLTPLADKQIDLIVSNPPYIPSSELIAETTSDTVGLTFEPKIALDGGQDGQTYVKHIKESGISAIVEGTGGIIETFNL